jgi:hypothetical protein
VKTSRYKTPAEASLSFSSHFDRLSLFASSSASTMLKAFLLLVTLAMASSAVPLTVRTLNQRLYRPLTSPLLHRITPRLTTGSPRRTQRSPTSATQLLARSPRRSSTATSAWTTSVVATVQRTPAGPIAFPRLIRSVSGHRRTSGFATAPGAGTAATSSARVARAWTAASATPLARRRFSSARFDVKAKSVSRRAVACRSSS